jgi:hypothetical protein
MFRYLAFVRMNRDSIEFNQVTVHYDTTHPETLKQTILELVDAVNDNVHFDERYPTTQQLSERIEQENNRIEQKANELVSIYEKYLDSETGAYENYEMGLHDERPHAMDTNYGIRLGEWERIAHPVPSRYIDEADVGEGLRRKRK